ncbi:uncharacterized protein A1O9_02530 [Exophiala aquamarina CBS 119918]|uniref:Carboxylesterase type B domain-containing protein n=1 Tax=Exophiala aquamarina CBS 119918 TaxID=1182545 RepID=A0A072PM58_9EURO|nr:uncharacterized protein A1O9_02530 [Exophiala aquamarina CBS 119918]KEF60966.1 hypothetical protein A1O9_02530 [Exophiala aquamarina CBS 119918]
MKSFFLYLPLLLSHNAVIAAPSNPCSCDTEVIDLGFARHKVTLRSQTLNGHLVNVYKNIRFAEPARRFNRPTFPPIADDPGVVRTGNYTHDTQCVSAVPQGVEIIYPGVNGTVFGSEDCLFLDVYVPADLPCRVSQTSPNSKSAGVPVLHWLYGSAYAFGSKEFYFTPLGLFDQLLSQDSPFILVVSNYRMGVYGWASSPNEEQTEANIGLYDGLAALKWSEKYIHHFGGDPSRITAGGQSTGAAIVELLSASAEDRYLPFQQAFISSPALPLKWNTTQRRREVFDTVLDAANCSSLICLQSVSEEELREVNRYLLNDVPSLSGGGNFGPGIGFGPIVDGDFVPDLPVGIPTLSKSLGRLKAIISANMANEGAITSSGRGMPEGFPSLVRRILPSATDETIARIQALYQWPDAAPEQLAWQWTADAVFVCHSIAIAEALETSTRRYVMSIPPAYHGLDSLYYFYTDDQITPVQDIAIARSLQALLGEFLYGSEPVMINEGIEWPVYGAGSFLNITALGAKVEDLDGREAQRCAVINEIFADQKNGI